MLAFAAALLMQVPGLLRHRDRKELVVYLVLMAVAFTFCALIGTGVLKPGFSASITRLSEPVLKALGLLPLLTKD